MNATDHPVADRARLVNRLRRWLLRRGSPRWQMTGIVAATGASGFLASVALLRLGLDRIPLRYLASVAIAYAVFLFLLYIWIRHRRELRESHEIPDVDAAAIDLTGLSSDLGTGAGGTLSPGGGQFAGAGASGSWDGSAGAGLRELPGSGGPDVGADLALDVDDAGVVIALAAAAAVLLGASIWVVATAPTLFAELLLDGALSAALYKRLRHLPRRHWLESALRRTMIPFLLAALMLGAAGWAMERYAPEAKSLGGVWKRLTT